MYIFTLIVLNFFLPEFIPKKYFVFAVSGVPIGAATVVIPEKDSSAISRPSVEHKPVQVKASSSSYSQHDMELLTLTF